MRKHRPTISNDGGRNLYCSRYSDCLDYAIKKAWDSWNCTKCELKNKVTDHSARVPVYSDDIVYYEFGEGFSSMDLDTLTNF